MKILMVEDHAFFSGALRSILGMRFSEGLLDRPTFCHAETLKDGLRLIAEAGPFALAIVDLMLPDGDGTEVVREVKSRWPETPVCVLSAAGDLSRAVEAGADEVLGKGLPLAQIIATLTRLVSEGGRTGG